MKTCPTCNGKKVIHVELNDYNEKTKKLIEMNCIDCQGHGTVSKDQYDNLMKQKHIWCLCFNSSGSTYVEDNVGIVSKHHWLCNDCHKVTQIG